MISDARVILIAAGAGIVVAGLGVAIVRADSPATGAADRSAVESKSMTSIAPPIPSPMPRKAVEQAPPATGMIPGGGAWTVGREIARGTYRTEGGRSCYWARLEGTPGAPWTLVTPGPQLGPQIVVLGGSDVAFATQGCAPWRRIR